MRSEVFEMLLAMEGLIIGMSAECIAVTAVKAPVIGFIGNDSKIRYRPGSTYQYSTEGISCNTILGRQRSSLILEDAFSSLKRSERVQ